MGDQEITRNDTVAIIVGSGPAGLATAASLALKSIPYIILEREDTYASLWTKYSYDRLHLHLSKRFCQLPHLPFPSSFPTFVPCAQFLQYLDNYVANFKICPKYDRNVESATYDEGAKKWVVKVKNITSNLELGSDEEYYSARFLVVASGLCCDPFVPEIEGLDTFLADHEIIHSASYKNGKIYSDKTVLVVGSGNSGMEIALDLANHGARTSIVVRSPVHVVARWAFSPLLGLLDYLPLRLVDQLLLMCGKLVYGDLTKYGIVSPKRGPIYMKEMYSKVPIIDNGTINQIKNGKIQVLPAVKHIRGNEVVFENGKSYPFDTIIFCTGFKRSVKKWLKGDDYLLNDDGISKQKYPNHWKGKNGLYCTGLARRGLHGITEDTRNIATDIKSLHCI